MYGMKAWNSIKFGLDFDDTVCLDVPFWIEFVQLVKKFGHTVTVVTARKDDGDNFDVDAFCKHAEVDVVYCDHKPKEDCFKADVWLDDSPSAIPNKSNLARRLRQLNEDTNPVGGW
jgi:hypothetical protein